MSDVNDRPPDDAGSEDSVTDNGSSWESERKLADRIMSHVTKNKMNLKLDELTRGRGNCFMIAVLQQLRHEAVYNVASPQVQELADEFSHEKFRQAIRNFVMNSNDSIIQDINENYNVAKSAGLYAETWDQYWLCMLKEGKWADSFFVQATAAFLKMDLKIVDTACNEDTPFYTIKCEEDSGPLATLTIGYLTNVHYQSLIPDSSVTVQEKVPTNLENESCPSCHKRLKNVLLHIKKSKMCRAKISDSVLKGLESKSITIKKMKQRNRKAKHNIKIKEMIRNNEVDESLLVEKQREAVAKHRAKAKDQNNQKVKELKSNKEKQATRLNTM